MLAPLRYRGNRSNLNSSIISFPSMFSLAHCVARAGIPTRMAMYSMRLYHDLVIDHYEHPRNVGKLVRKGDSL